MTFWERISATLKQWRKQWPQVRGRIVETTKRGWAWVCRRWHALTPRQQLITAAVAAVVLIAVSGALLIRRTSSTVDRTGSTDTASDTRPRAVEQTVTDDVKDAKKAASGVAELGDEAKRVAEVGLVQMRLSRFNLYLTPAQEFILLERVYGMGQFSTQLATIGVSAAKRQEKIAFLEGALSKRIQAGNGPAKAVRLQFARVETLGGQWTPYYFPEGTGFVSWASFEGTPGLMNRMVRGQDPTAADIAKLVHGAVAVASSARRAAEFEREFNKLLVLAVGRTGVATYYGRSDDATPEACLAERLDASSAVVVGLYAHAKDTFDFFLGSSPEVPFKFEFPELTPDEMRRANVLISELAARRAGK